MAERSTGLMAGLITVIIMTTGALAFMFAMWIEVDETRQVIDAVVQEAKDLKDEQGELEVELGKQKGLLTQKTGERDQAIEKRDEIKGLRDSAQSESEQERSRIQPAVRDLSNSITDGHNRIKSVDEAMRQDLSSFENTKRSKEEELRQANERLVSAIATFEEKEKNIDVDIAQINAKLEEVQARLKKIQAEALRRKTISDAGGQIISVSDKKSNFCVINLGTADRIRKGQKFQVWALRRGYGLGWVQVKGRNFVEEGILPGDLLIVGRGEEMQKFPVVAVGISREAELKGTGLARRTAYDTLKIAGPGVNELFTVAGLDYKIERASTAMTAEEVGAEVRGMIEIAEVRTHTSDAFSIPERKGHPVCPQCGWEAYLEEMSHCPYCFLGDSHNEVQQLDKSVKTVLNKAENAFLPVSVGDRLSNPYFSSNRPLIFVLGSETVRRNRQELKAFIEENGGTVLEPQLLLRRPDDLSAVPVYFDVQSSEVNYLIPGTGPDANNLLKRARELGIRVMREEEIFEFFGEPM
jgi:hypothetical protein